MQESPQIPIWWYRNKRPINDDRYFENLCRVIFQTGLTWGIIEKKWPTIKKALKGFDVQKIACFNNEDINKLLNDPGMIRNIYKIHAIIENAKRFQVITKRYGSFQAYLDSFDKSDNYAKVVKELADTFERIGPTTAELFLYSVGEKIRPTRFY